MNTKAQYSEVFRFLIAAVMGLAILVIVLGLIDSLEDITKNANMTDFYAKMDSAVEGAGIGEYVISKDIAFVKNQTLTELAIKGRYTNIDSVHFDGIDSCFTLTGNGITAKKDCKVNAYIWCNNTFEDKIECYINFGIKPMDVS